MIDCIEAIRQMAPYLDRELSEAEIAEVKAHLAHCDCCGNAFRFEESVLTFVREGLSGEDVPADLESRLFAKLEDEE